MTDLANVLGLLAQSPALSVPVTVVLILLSPAQPVAMDLHANTQPPVPPVPPRKWTSTAGSGLDGGKLREAILRNGKNERFVFVTQRERQ